MSIADVLHGKGHQVVKVSTGDTVAAAVGSRPSIASAGFIVEDQWMRHAGIFSKRDLVMRLPNLAGRRGIFR